MEKTSRNKYREYIAQSFVAALSEKGLNWKRGWETTHMAACNAVTGAPYRGVNRFHLGLRAIVNGYADPRWATMVQIIDRDGKYHPGETWRLQKGSKAVQIEYWYPWNPNTQATLSWSEYRKLPEKERAQYMLGVRYAHVFHASMIDGIPPLQAPARETPNLSEIVSRLSSSMGVELLYDGGDNAFYRPSEDKIHLPAPEAFFSEYELNATALHELAHATGHAGRLNRIQTARFGTPEYAYEELVAEISSCFMGVALEQGQTAQHLENHKAYVQSWIQDITDKPETLMQAIRDAQRAAGYMDLHAGLVSEKEHETGKERMATAPAETSPAPAPEPRIHPWSPVTRGGKLHFTDEQYRIAREASALEYARRQGYHLVREGSRYHLKEHDSMVFLPNGRWFWNSRSLSGRAIEFIQHYEGKTLPEAVLTLNGIDWRQPEARPQTVSSYQPSSEDLAAANTRPEFALPPRADKMNRAFAYLVNARGLDYELVRQLVHEGRIYEGVNKRPDGSELHNAVFVGYDREGTPRSASLRGCSQGSSFKLEQAGSDKTWPFEIPGKEGCTTLCVFESAIDAASHATIQKLAGLDWQSSHRIGQSGNAPVEAILNKMASHSEIKEICFCLDNDAAGQQIFERMRDRLIEHGVAPENIRRQPVPVGKDWNEYLQVWRRTLMDHEKLPTTEFAGPGGGECVGRIHHLDPDHSVSRTVAYSDQRHFRNAAACRMGGLHPCIVETPAQLAEVQKERRRAGEQGISLTATRGMAKADKALAANEVRVRPDRQALAQVR